MRANNRNSFDENANNVELNLSYSQSFNSQYSQPFHDISYISNTSKISNNSYNNSYNSYNSYNSSHSKSSFKSSSNKSNYANMSKASQEVIKEKDRKIKELESKLRKYEIIQSYKQLYEGPLIDLKEKNRIKEKYRNSTKINEKKDKRSKSKGLKDKHHFRKLSHNSGLERYDDETKLLRYYSEKAPKDLAEQLFNQDYSINPSKPSKMISNPISYPSNYNIETQGRPRSNSMQENFGPNFNPQLYMNALGLDELTLKPIFNSNDQRLRLPQRLETEPSLKNKFNTKEQKLKFPGIYDKHGKSLIFETELDTCVEVNNRNSSFEGYQQKRLEEKKAKRKKEKHKNKDKKNKSIRKEKETDSVTEENSCCNLEITRLLIGIGVSIVSIITGSILLDGGASTHAAAASCGMLSK